MRLLLWVLVALSLAFAVSRVAYSDRPFKFPATGTVPRSIYDKMAELPSVRDCGAKGDGSTVDASAFNTCITNISGVIYVPASASCYNLGSTTVNLRTGVTLQGMGRGPGGGNGPSCVVYTGTGCAFMLDSAQSAGIKDLDIQVNSASATAMGICLRDTTATAEFNTIEGNRIIQTNATRRVAGQQGISCVVTTSNGVYWNTIRNNRFGYWDSAIKFVGSTSPVNGCNDNEVSDIVSWGHVTALSISVNSQDNTVHGVRCSRSDGTWAGTANCIVIGDGVNESFGTQISGSVSDQGSPSTCLTINLNARGTTAFVDCESGTISDGNTSTTFPSLTYSAVNGASPAILSFGILQATVGMKSTGPFRFATYTSCTTAASAGATCTSGSASISPAFADTNYRISCTMNNISGIPRIIGVTKTSGSAFTLTIEAGTAVAAGGNFDCLLMHL